MCLLRRHHVIAIAQRSCARAWSRQGEDARRLQHNRGEAVERARLGYACRPGAWARWPQAGAAEVAGRRQRAATAAARMGPSRAPPRVTRDAISVQSSRPAKIPKCGSNRICMHATCGGMVYNRSLHQLTSEIRPGATPRTNFSALAATRRTVAARDRIVAKPVRGVAASSVASLARTYGRRLRASERRGREGGREGARGVSPGEL